MAKRLYARTPVCRAEQASVRRNGSNREGMLAQSKIDLNGHNSEGFNPQRYVALELNRTPYLIDVDEIWAYKEGEIGAFQGVFRAQTVRDASQKVCGFYLDPVTDEQELVEITKLYDHFDAQKRESKLEAIHRERLAMGTGKFPAVKGKRHPLARDDEQR